MAAESTPLRSDLKISFVDMFDDVTPVRKNNFKLKKRKYLCEGARRGASQSSEESDPEPMMKSQVHKKRSQEYKSKTDRRMSAVHNGNPNNSDDLADDENFYSSVKSQRFSKIKFIDSGIDKLLLNADYDLEKEFEVLHKNSEMFDSKLFRSELKSGSHIMADIIKDSKSLTPMDEKSYFSNLIKKKLLNNASNKEMLKSQTSGWTQSSESFDKEICQLSEVGSFYGLPVRVQELYEELKGIKELYYWQQECLKLEAVRMKKNLVYALPTSGGKSLVAEILILREILLHRKNVLLILPFVSIVQEKIRDFSQFSLEFGFSVEEYAAGKGVIPPKKHRRRNSLLVATIEKALIVINSLIESNRLEEWGLVVVDELHLLSEEGRGPTLETLMVQILHSGKNIQVVGMTATIGNLNEVATFLGAESYAGNFRPVHLKEYLKCGNKIYSVCSASEELMKEIRTLDFLNEEDTDGIGQLVKEVIPDDSVLIFCPTKKNCENIALLLTRLLPGNLMEHQKVEKTSLYRALISETNDQICPTLKETIPFGVAYHHSGLTTGERKLLEEAFRLGTLSVICCTSTLAAGVNLPAKRVILRSPYIGKDLISLSKYKQMVGRAGRMGLKSEGESYLICQLADLEKVNELFRSEMDEATSKLDLEGCKDLVLSAIGLGSATSRRELWNLLRRSLLHHQFKKLGVDTKEMVDECIVKLYEQGALKIENCLGGFGGDSETATLELHSCGSNRSLTIGSDDHLKISRLGRAALKGNYFPWWSLREAPRHRLSLMAMEGSDRSSLIGDKGNFCHLLKGGLSVETAQELYEELVKAQANLVLLTSLHLLYLVTPYDLTAQIKPNFSIFFNVYMQFGSKEVQTARAIGITEFVISKLAVGVQPKNIKGTVLNRFYISLILNELWNQKTIWEVAMLFQMPRGLVQTVMTSAATFANCVLRFCEELKEFWSFKSLLTEFAPRLAHCCAPELLPLMDLPAVRRGRARQLYKAGFKTLEMVARAKPGELVRCVEHMPHKVAAQIVAAAKMLLMERAESLKEEAEDVLEGLKE